MRFSDDKKKDDYELDLFLNLNHPKNLKKRMYICNGDEIIPD